MINTIFSPALIAAADTGFKINKSALFVKADAEYLSADSGFGTPDNADVGTLSMWFKRASVGGSNLRLFTHGSGGSVQIQAYFTSANKLVVGNGSEVTTTQTFTSTTDWQHLVVRVDTSQGTAADRVRLYLNGSQITSFDAASYPSQNGNVFTSTGWRIGSWTGSTTSTFDGRMAEVIYVDNRSLAPTAFAESDGGTWVPIDPEDAVSVSSTAEEVTNVTSATSSADATSYTFSSVALGAAADNRAIYVFMTGQESTGAAPTITPVTVGGVSATKISDVNNSVEPQYPGSLWRADVPSGTTGDISVTLNKTMSQFGVIVWAVTGDHKLFDLQVDSSTSTASFSLSNVPDNSLILAGRGGTGSRTHTWSSDVDENIDQVIADGVVMSGASKEHSTGGNFTVTCTPNSTDGRPRTFCLVLSPNQGVGANGFYLNMASSGSDLGDDASGNSNDFTNNNSATQSTDTPSS